MLDLKAASIAANRFGLGAKPGELDAIAKDPRAWLSRQLVAETVAGTASWPAQLTGFLKAQHERKADIDAFKEFRKAMQQDFRAAAAKRTLDAANSPTPFRERLVQFWSNHFTVSVQRPVVVPTAVGFENEAIRPNIFGNFRDMLKTVAAHPAMLLYLDNIKSIGPNSGAGLKNKHGLNENLAREMMELHTVGVDGGYTQTDVTELAKILTGWSIANAQEPNSGQFRYRPFVHEPGDKTVMGKTYREAGQNEAITAMNDLAARPATARHIATKLARHFVADDPPKAAVDALARTYMETDGDLRAVTMTLIGLPQIWAEPQTKIKTPNELVISACRSFGITDVQAGEMLLMGLRQMEQAPFTAPSPAGWPDTADSWISPEAMMTRVEWAMAVGQKLEGQADARDIAKATIQPVASQNTLFHIDHAPSAAEALALLIASPEFQRR
ncbi:MAG TPA: DUF1800 domain-containing protein [Alphaproteobacteria bacterium]|jgi:uncharacterized protein (DUF1800 family)|nr:DUF1800 domain-containing protein [Alphaproteobacteria bacterium]